MLLLFLLYIDDITIFFDNGILCNLNGGDTKLYDVIQSGLDGARFQFYLDRLPIWCETWQLSISIKNATSSELEHASTPLYTKKTNLYRFGNAQLPAQEAVRYLGITIQCNLGIIIQGDLGITIQCDLGITIQCDLGITIQCDLKFQP